MATRAVRTNIDMGSSIVGRRVRATRGGRRATSGAIRLDRGATGQVRWQHESLRRVVYATRLTKVNHSPNGKTGVDLCKDRAALSWKVCSRGSAGGDRRARAQPSPRPSEQIEATDTDRVAPSQEFPSARPPLLQFAAIVGLSSSVLLPHGKRAADRMRCRRASHHGEWFRLKCRRIRPRRHR